MTRTKFVLAAPVVKIDRDIPIPLAKNQAALPFDKLHVGDSFLIPGALMHQVSTAVTRATKRTGAKYTCRTTPEGVRVWRIQ